MNILIADDDPIVRAVVQRVVQQANYDLIEAENGAEALQLIEHADPDVLITDLQMPVLDGFALVEKVRASARHRAMPIVCLSSVSDRSAITRLAEMGISGYVLKPIRPRDLVDRLRMVVANHLNWKLARDAQAAPTTPAVLVIDPDPDFRWLVASALATDFTVVEAPTGASAITAFRTHMPRIATVLIAEGLDLLDEVRVAGLLRRLATDDGAPAPTVILVSAADRADEAKAAGFDGAIRRPVAEDELLAAIAPWLARSPVLAATAAVPNAAPLTAAD